MSHTEVSSNEISCSGDEQIENRRSKITRGEGELSVKTSSGKKGKRLLVDISIIGAMTMSVALLKSDIREGILERGSLDNIIENFKDPYNKAKEGARIDDDSFILNYVAHPLSYTGMGLYLKERGYSDWSALTFTQVHNIIWEYVIEGSFVPPSGKDLITNLTSSGISIFVMDRLSRYGEKHIDKRWYYHILYWLNPFNPINDKFFKKGFSGAFNIYVTEDRLLKHLGISITY